MRYGICLKVTWTFALVAPFGLSRLALTSPSMLFSDDFGSCFMASTSTTRFAACSIPPF